MGCTLRMTIMPIPPHLVKDAQDCERVLDACMRITKCTRHEVMQWVQDYKEEMYPCAILRALQALKQKALQDPEAARKAVLRL